MIGYIWQVNGTHLKVPGHALGGGRQEQLGRILDAARQLLTLLHIQHQVRLRLYTAILQSTPVLQTPVRQVCASQDACSAGSLTWPMRKHSSETCRAR